MVLYVVELARLRYRVVALLWAAVRGARSYALRGLAEAGEKAENQNPV
jgi:hypothetical protein